MTMNLNEAMQRICRLKAMLTRLENETVAFTEQLNGEGCDFCGDAGFNEFYAETAAIDSHFNAMLAFCANSEAVAMA